MNYQEQVEHYRQVKARISGAPLKPKPKAIPIVVQEVEQPKIEQKPRFIRNFKERIIHECADEYGVTVEDVLGVARKNQVVLARRKAAWLFWKNTKMSYPQIGRLLNKDHSTIIYAVRTYEKELRKMEGDRRPEGA